MSNTEVIDHEPLPPLAQGQPSNGDDDLIMVEERHDDLYNYHDGTTIRKTKCEYAPFQDLTGIACMTSYHVYHCQHNISNILVLTYCWILVLTAPR